MLTESVPVALAFPAPKPASSHILNQPTSGVGPLAGESSASGRGTPLSAPTVEGNTAWPEAAPDLTDLPHTSDCTDCLSSEDDRMPDIDCVRCGYIGEAIIAHRTYSIVTAHCPMCGETTSEAVDHDRDAA